MAKRQKTGGRTKGTPNKLTGTIREKIDNRLDIDGLFDLIEQVRENDPAKASELMIKLLPYVSARLKEVELSGSEYKSPIEIEIVRRKD